MGVEQVLALAAQFGPMGLFVGYQMWREVRGDKCRSEETAARLEYDKNRLECDKALATSLATLSAVIQGRT